MSTLSSRNMAFVIRYIFFNDHLSVQNSAFLVKYTWLSVHLSGQNIAFVIRYTCLDVQLNVQNTAILVKIYLPKCPPQWSKYCTRYKLYMISPPQWWKYGIRYKINMLYNVHQSDQSMAVIIRYMCLNSHLSCQNMAGIRYKIYML